MNWIDKLERRYGNLGIPNLINGLLIGQLAAGIIMLFFNRDFGSLLMLSRTYVLHGQIWRLITFLFVPIWLGGVGQLLSDRLRRAERHLPEHAVRLHLAVAGSDGAAVWHHSVQDEIPGLDRAGVLGLQLFDGQLRHQGQPRAGAGGFSGVLWPRGL